MILSDGRDSETASAEYQAYRRARTSAYFAASPDLDQKTLTGATERHQGAFSDGQKES
jgi:hypothetical protein